jgi:type IV pilus assembly protein PilB
VSTIHTNSAAETLTRILNMGIPAFLLPASINAIIAQRLIRKLCQHLKVQKGEKLAVMSEKKLLFGTSQQ